MLKKIFFIIIGSCIYYFLAEGVPELSKRSQHFSLFLHMQWITDSHCKKRFHPLHYYISEKSKNIDPIYALSEEDFSQYAPEIINCFVKHFVELYWKEKIFLDKKELRLDHENYFLFHLLVYLYDGCTDSLFNDHSLSFETNHVSYGSWGCDEFDSTRSLTDFGLIYFKFLYATCIACLNSKEIIPLVRVDFLATLRESLEKDIKNKGYTYWQHSET